jgi:hypothetical protein
MLRSFLLPVLVLATFGVSAGAQPTRAPDSPGAVRRPVRIVTGGAPDTVLAAAERPRLRRAGAIAARELPQFAERAVSGAFTLSPMRLAMPDRAWLELWSATVVPDDAGGQATLRGGQTDGYAMVRLTIYAEQGRTYLLDFVTHMNCAGSCGPEQFTVSTPAGPVYLPVSGDNPHALVGYTPTQSGWYRFQLTFDDPRMWTFEQVSVTAMQ